MLSSRIQDLKAAQAKVAELEAEISRDLRASLATLHEDFGFTDVSSFVTAVQSAAGTAYRSGKKSVAASGRRTRAKITAATHAGVKKLAKAGKTGAAIAEELGISLPSVQNIKKALGLVTPRKSKKKKAPTKKKAAKNSPAPSAPASVA